jgi:hypothetical protein
MAIPGLDRSTARNADAELAASQQRIREAQRLERERAVQAQVRAATADLRQQEAGLVAGMSPATGSPVSLEREVQLLVDAGADRQEAEQMVQRRRATQGPRTEGLFAQDSSPESRAHLERAILLNKEASKRHARFDRELGEAMGHPDVQPAPPAPKRATPMSATGAAYHTVPGPVGIADGSSAPGAPLTQEAAEAYRYRKPSHLATDEEKQEAAKLGLYSGGPYLPSQEDLDMFKRGYVYTWNQHTGARGWTPVHPGSLPVGKGEPGRLGVRDDLTRPMKDAEGREMPGSSKYEQGRATTPFGAVAVYTPSAAMRKRMEDDKQARIRDQLAERAGIAPSQAAQMTLADLRSLAKDKGSSDKAQRRANVQTQAQVYNEARQRGVNRGLVEHQRRINEAQDDRARGAAMFNHAMEVGNPEGVRAAGGFMRGAQDVDAVRAIPEGAEAGPVERMRRDADEAQNLPWNERVMDAERRRRAMAQPGQPVDEAGLNAGIVFETGNDARRASRALVSGEGIEEGMEDMVRDWTARWLQGAGGQAGPANYRQWRTQLGIEDSDRAAALYFKLTGVNPGRSRRAAAGPGSGSGLGGAWGGPAPQLNPARGYP